MKFYKIMMADLEYLPSCKKSHVRFNPWYYLDQYNSLHEYYMQNKSLAKLDRYNIDHEREFNQVLQPYPAFPEPNDIIVIEDSVSYCDISSMHTSQKNSEKYFTGQEDFSDRSESVSSLERLVNENSVTDLINLLNQIVDEHTPLELKREAELTNESEFTKNLVSCTTMNVTSLWSTIMTFADRVMHASMQSGITDTRFQLPLSILICNALVTRGIVPGVKTLFCTLQPFVSPCESIMSASRLHYPAETYEAFLARENLRSDEKMKDHAQQYSINTTEDSLSPKISNWMLNASEADTNDTYNTRNLMIYLENYFKCLDELKNIVHSDSVQMELNGGMSDIYCDSTLNDFDEDFSVNHHYENPMLKIIPNFYKQTKLN